MLEQEVSQELTPPAGEVIRFRANDRSPETVVTIPGGMQKHALADLEEKSDDAIFRMVRLRGIGGYAYVGEKARLKEFALNIIGDNNIVIIGAGCSLKGTAIIKGNNRIVLIGARTTFYHVNILCRSGGHVHIGKDCMFSNGIEVRTSDSHAIIDTVTKKNVNTAEGVYVGDHVWVGKETIIQKGAVIANDNVLAIASFVRGTFEASNTIIAGTPAKVVRTDRTWSRDELVDPDVTDIYAWKSVDFL